MKALQTALEMYYADNGAYPSSSAGPRANSCYSDGSSDLGGTINAKWTSALSILVSSGYISQLPVDPLNNGTFGSYAKYCYAYATSTTVPHAWSDCRHTVTDEIINIGNRGYALYLSLENPPAGRFQIRWNDVALKPANYCIVGPAKG